MQAPIQGNRSKPKLLYRLRDPLRSRHLSHRTEQVHRRSTRHTFRHSSATHLLDDGHDIRTVQELVGNKDVRNYSHQSGWRDSGGARGNLCISDVGWTHRDLR